MKNAAWHTFNNNIFWDTITNKPSLSKSISISVNTIHDVLNSSLVHLDKFLISQYNKVNGLWLFK